MPKKLFLIAGETSGDLQGSHLVAELKKMVPDLECRGLGGPLMEAEGVKLMCDLTKESVLGLGDVLKKYFWFRKIFDQALREVDEFKPDAIVLIDYPGFNLRFAKKINKRFPLIYFISPQIWAWGGRRIHLIRRVVSHMITFFQFEEELYKRAGVSVTWAGHPLVDIVKPTKPKNEIRAEFLKHAADQTKIVTLFPGSRHTEVERILPEMLASAKLIQARMTSDVKFFISKTQTLPAALYTKAIERAGLSAAPEIVTGRGYDLLFASDFAMISSGTATLEAALTEVPFVIFYKTAASTFFLGRLLVQIPCIGLVNIVAGRKIIPEFIQHEIHPERVAEEACHLMESADLRRKMITDLAEIKSKLGPGGAARRAAEAVAKVLLQK